jgi:YspA, cpYpsA-related SLOG family
MRTIIAGSRDIDFNLSTLCEAIANSGFAITEVISGGARGADRLGEVWAGINKLPCTQFLPDWTTHGKAAGILRNKRMAEYAEALIALWDGESRGTQNMIDEARKRGLKVYVHQSI